MEGVIVFFLSAGAILAIVRVLFERQWRRMDEKRGKKKTEDLKGRFLAMMERDGEAFNAISRSMETGREKDEYLAMKLREDHPDDMEYAKAARKMGIGGGAVKRNGGDDFSPFVIGAIGSAGSNHSSGSDHSCGGSCGGAE